MRRMLILSLALILTLAALPAWSSGTQAASPPFAEPAKWIEIDLAAEKLTAWQGNTPVYSTLVSTGLAAHPTPTGVFHVDRKLRSDLMTGPGYYLPNVPYVMYFYTGGYAIHGTYWHHNFGHPMSHGCVNLPTPAAEWMYNWAPMGTTVWIH
ncbi:L,D-transpeptidase [Nitrolancea hollandica]|uniref:ErfK/YbiS/YcfS/YnhG family protein n=1 Tax=Nitrolancea hollandica Lb TaxID=1129897 RepID=I4ENL0_9BACT